MTTEKWADIEYKKALPLVMRDWRELAARGVTIEALRQLNIAAKPDPALDFVAHVLRKAGYDPDFVNALRLIEFVRFATEVLEAVLEAEGVVPDLPTSASSTS